jgi:hypothetical protein
MRAIGKKIINMAMEPILMHTDANMRGIGFAIKGKVEQNLPSQTELYMKGILKATKCKGKAY